MFFLNQWQFCFIYFLSSIKWLFALPGTDSTSCTSRQSSKCPSTEACCPLLEGLMGHWCSCSHRGHLRVGWAGSPLGLCSFQFLTLGSPSLSWAPSVKCGFRLCLFSASFIPLCSIHGITLFLLSNLFASPSHRLPPWSENMHFCYCRKESVLWDQIPAILKNIPASLSFSSFIKGHYWTYNQLYFNFRFWYSFSINKKAHQEDRHNRCPGFGSAGMLSGLLGSRKGCVLCSANAGVWLGDSMLALKYGWPGWHCPFHLEKVWLLWFCG